MPVKKGRLIEATVKIAVDDDYSESKDITSYQLVGVEIPAGVTADTIGIQGSDDDTTFLDVADSNGDNISIYSEGAKIINLTPDQTVAVDCYKYVRLSMGEAQTSNDVTFKLLVRKID